MSNTSASRPRVLVISPLYYPDEEGLAHYTTEFCRHLQQDADVTVLTGVRAAETGPGGVLVLPWLERWDLAGLLLALGRARFIRPDRILIQFVPFMYARRGGINFAIVAAAAVAALHARMGGNGGVQIMFHELWHWRSSRPRELAMHLAHRTMVVGLCLAARDVFCATERFASEVRDALGGVERPIHLLAVGSNLERAESALRPRPPHDGPLRVGLFGSLHASKNVPMVLRALQRASARAKGRIKVSVIGLERRELSSAVPDLADWLDAEATVTGWVTADQAAAKLAEQDFLVSYFQDGVSSRRGSLLAALCEGVPVVTTWRDVSDTVFLDQPWVKLLSCDAEEFGAQLETFLTSAERPFAGVTAAEVRKFYDAHFSWRALVQRYLDISFPSP